MDECRKQFEELMGAPPYEVNLRRCTEESAWPGNYRDYEVQLAWCAWEDLWNRRAEAVPEGYKLVPIEPTKEMQKAALRADDDAFGVGIYKAMLAAEPEVKQ